MQPLSNDWCVVVGAL